jgi:serine/threonine protein kinase
MCLEYCPYGDSTDLFTRHSEHHKKAGPGADITQYMLPEPAIWCAFEALIKAGLVTEHGSVGVGVQPPAQWDGAPVVHLDLKPDNLFIGEFPDQNVGSHWVMYPSFKIADFGLSFDDNRRPRAFAHYRGRGTPGYQAPEQLEEVHYHGRRPIDPMDTKTNVWGVGITIMAMMSMDTEAGAKDFREAARNEDHPFLVPRFTPDAQRKYSNVLQGMVTDCLQFRHVNRLTFRTLLNNLELATDLGGPYDHAHGARFATVLNPAPNATLGHMLSNDYVIGFMMPPSNTIQPS